MKSNWLGPRKRGSASVIVWSKHPTFSLVDLTLDQHTANVDQLPVLARSVSDAEDRLSTATELAGQVFGQLANLNVRAAGVIAGALGADHELAPRLDAIYAITSGHNEADELARARLVLKLWEDFDAVQQSVTPSKSPLTLELNKVQVGSVEFGALLANAMSSQQSEATAEKNVTDAASALEKLQAKVDQDNKRWYAAWTKMYPAGTLEGDAARSNVPTSRNGHAPQPVGIANLEALADDRVAVTYADTGGKNAKVLALQWRSLGRDVWSGDVALERPRQVVGPFPAGGTYEFRTRAAKSRGKSRWSAVRSVDVKGQGRG